ncbi:response regulator transcription factor [Streptomyces hirsutus]
MLSQHVEQLYRGSCWPTAVARWALLQDRVFDAEQFVDAVRRVAAGGTAMDPQVIQQLLARKSADDRPLARLTPRERKCWRRWLRAGPTRRPPASWW